MALPEPTHRSTRSGGTCTRSGGTCTRLRCRAACAGSRRGEADLGLCPFVFTVSCFLRTASQGELKDWLFGAAFWPPRVAEPLGQLRRCVSKRQTISGAAPSAFSFMYAHSLQRRPGSFFPAYQTMSALKRPLLWWGYWLMSYSSCHCQFAWQSLPFSYFFDPRLPRGVLAHRQVPLDRRALAKRTSSQVLGVAVSGQR